MVCQGPLTRCLLRVCRTRNRIEELPSSRPVLASFLADNDDGDNNSTGIDLCCNEWALLNSPLDDIFLTVVLPSYLTIPDLVRLSAVSRRYRKLFKSSGQANRALSTMLRRDSMWSIREGGICRGDIQLMNHLPTLRGNFVSLSNKMPTTTMEDPWLVAELRSAASRRRGLVHLNLEHNTVEENRSVVSHFQARDDVFLRTPFARNRVGRYSGRARFVCFNESNENVYCHWIDFSGTLTIREGDCKPPRTTAQDAAVNVLDRGSFLWPGCPSNVFSHSTYLYHSFALCLQEGGPPFAIYQARRGWQVGDYDHFHVISILPGGQIEELHCNGPHDVRSLYRFDLLTRQLEHFYHLLSPDAARPIGL
jgi:hypothetical protein